MISAIGEILVDDFIENNKHDLHVGGAVYNLAGNIATFNGDVSFFGAIGNDEYGEFLYNATKKDKKIKVILKRLPFRSGFAEILLKDGERYITLHRDDLTDTKLDISIFSTLKKEPHIIHFGSLFLSSDIGVKFIKDTVNMPRFNNAIFSMDVNYRNGIRNSKEEELKVYKEVLSLMNIIKISDDELFYFTGIKDIKKACESIFRKDQVVVISLGANGSTLVYKDLYVHAPAIKVNVIDTTGAGDAFYSYVLYRLDSLSLSSLNENNVKDILTKANIAGAIATTKKGASGVVPSLEEIDSLIA